MATQDILSRRELAECLRNLQEASTNEVIQDEKFIYYHLNRNYFNDKYAQNEQERPSLKELWQITDKTFEDNLNRIWVEETVGIIYHRPFDKFSEKTQYISDLFRERSKRYCRKFVSRDEYVAAEGYDGGCEFELIIRHNQRMTGGPFMETYNFGGSATLGLVGSINSTKFGLHGKFDVDPHKKYNRYVTTHYSSQSIKIHDWIK